MKMLKRALTLFLTLMLLGSVGAMAAAPRWDSGARVRPTLSRSGNTLTCEVNVSAVGASDRITADISVEKQRASGGWEVLDYWTGKAGTGKLYFEETYTGSKVTSGTYRVSYTVTVTSSKGSDVITGEKEVSV